MPERSVDPDSKAQVGRRRLFPPEVSWVGYFWLVYLLNIPLVLLFMQAELWRWLVSLVVVAVFLPLYVLSFWWPPRRQLWLVAMVTLLAMVSVPLTPGASVLFVYAAAMCGEAGPPRVAARAVFAVVVALLLDVALVVLWLGWGLPEVLYAFLPALIFTVIVGAINIFEAEKRRANAKLRRTQEEVERLAAVAERERIARDLHDLLGHTLSTITLKSELAGKLLPVDPERAAQEISEVEAISRQALSQVRTAVRGYRRQGWAGELASSKVALEAGGVTLAYCGPGELPAQVTAEQERALCFIVREAVTNILRHSEASRCAVTLEVTSEGEGAALELQVFDNGRGLHGSEGNGLTGVRERARALGGTVELASAPGRGVQLTVSLPSRTLPVKSRPAAAPTMRLEPS